jgi:serine/threonine-protein kinase
MGEVYKAEDLKLKQIVALKFLPDAVARDATALARFQTEVRITRQISHPNVCRVYDIGETDGMHFLSMEFIDGEDMSLLLRRIGRLPGDKANEIARQICAGLASAHDNGVLHRDLKPANIMIDGRGKARITDFGVAVVAKELFGAEAASGTPAYMAPEQLKGEEVTQRSDIYSLGLVLYELFTGKRVYDSDNILELLRLHESSAPTNPSSHVEDIDPLVERVILRCLEKEPNKRPTTAIQVSAALPGGDPLAAALAAGETPSPEMVAAAGEKAGLRPAVAVALLAAIVTALVISAFLGNSVNWQAKVLHENSPDALANKAREIIKRLGYTDRPVDSASGLGYDSDFRQYAEQESPSADRWRWFTQTQPAPINFWYRESPRYLEVTRWDNGGWVSHNDPPYLEVSGMVNVWLDPHGRLILFAAAPPQIDVPGDTTKVQDWTALFASAGLDMAVFTPTESTWAPPMAFDTRAAWTGTFPDHPDLLLRIEAAAYRGKPVYFKTIAPWTRPSRMQDAQPTALENIRITITIILIFAVLVGAVLLARYNLRQGRGDSRGAMRVALVLFAVSMVGWLFGASHAPTFDEVPRFFLIAISPALTLAGVFWLVYIALEPYARRRMPHTIISWSRVLTGGIHDSLVGRDILIGCLAGVSWTLLDQLENLVRLRFNATPLTLEDGLDAWLGVRYLVAQGFLNNVQRAIVFSLYLFFLMLLWRILTRRQWLAVGIFFLLGLSQSVRNWDDPTIAVVFACLNVGTTAIVLLRFGFLTLAIGIFVNALLIFIPLTTEFSAWYTNNMIVVAAAVLALSAFAFHASLGGQKLIQGDLLDE